MKNLFKSNWTKWIPLGTFIWDYPQYIVFVRGNKKNGMLQFNTKRVNPLLGSDCVSPILPTSLIDPTTQWQELQKLMAS